MVPSLSLDSAAPAILTVVQFNGPFDLTSLLALFSLFAAFKQGGLLAAAKLCQVLDLEAAAKAEAIEIRQT